MKNLIIPFGGFYESNHSNMIERIVESCVCDDTGEPIEGFDYDMVNYHKMHISYCKVYLTNILEDYMLDNYNLDFKFHFVAMSSPKYYNYNTDTIEAKISNANYAKLVSKFKNDTDFKAFLADVTTSYDGFTSFYTASEALKDSNVLGDYILDYICNNIEAIIYEYFDSPVIYEMECILDSKGDELLSKYWDKQLNT